MNHTVIRIARSRWLIGLLLLGVLLAAAGAALAQSGGGYDLRWNTIDGGGITFASGGPYRLGGTIGQADAGVLAGGTFTLSGGFWGGLPAMRYRVYLPVVLRGWTPR
jgi:hypothetical protein